jgi:processive 1,2-diacylglycerol beta-glucosyltransferase
MAAKKKLLFLYMVPATGHQRAAEAIMKAAGQMNPQIECVGLDAGNQAYPLLGSVFNKMYLQLIQRTPAIWDYLYDNPDVEEVTREMRQIFTLFSSLRLKKILKQHHPEAVICTQAMPAIAMSALKRRGILKAPLVGVVTDFGVHAYWYHNEIDLYLVGHEDIKDEMMRKGVARNRIRVTGIPIDPRFGETEDPLPLRARMRFHSHKKTILVMGGSHGLGSLDNVVEALKTIPMSFQTIVVCGRNKSLQRRILQAVRGEEGFQILGYVRDMSGLMAAADLVVTKPGGLSTSEALAKELPMVLTDPIPGQEQRNVQFLARHGVARLANTNEELIHLVSDLLRHPKRISAMRQRSRLLGKPYSAWEAARSIFSLINRHGWN